MVALVVHRAIADLTDEQKSVDNYVFAFRRDEAHLHVIFIPRITKDSPFTVGGETPQGREAHYVVEKGTYRVLSQTFGE